MLSPNLALSLAAGPSPSLLSWSVEAVTPLAAQGVAVAIGGGALIFAVVWLTRQGRLSLRYGLGWLTVAVLGLVGSVLLRLVAPLADALRMSPTGLLLGASSFFLVLLALQLSISVSGLQDAVRDLSESNALLEQRVQEAEQHADDSRRMPGQNLGTGPSRGALR